MPWYGRPAVAYAMFLPAATAGLLLPYVLAPPSGKPGSSSPGRRSLGTALLFAIVCSALTSVGMVSAGRLFWVAFKCGHGDGAPGAGLLTVSAPLPAAWFLVLQSAHVLDPPTKSSLAPTTLLLPCPGGHHCF